MEYQNICMGCMGDKGQADVCPHCGYIEGTPPPNAQYLPPRTLLAGKYLIGRGLGHGGFGITYLAYDTVLKRKLAIKEHFPQDCATRNPATMEVTPFSAEEKQEQFAYGVEKFLEEARTLAQFDGHPNIVGVRDFFKENGTAYYVMNYLSGETLKEYLRRHDRALSYQQALKIMLPVMDALRTVHGAGVLHRDVSPDNIFLTSGGQVKLIDFGAARQPMSGQRSISVILKPGYAPEEQYRTHGKQGPWTDVYATAATFYRAITGKVPPESLDRSDQDTLSAPSMMGVRIPQEAERAILRAMAVRAGDRFQSMQAFKDALTSADDAAPAPVPRPIQPPVQRPSAPTPGPQPPIAQRREQQPPLQRREPARREDPVTYPLVNKGGGRKAGIGILIAALIVLVVVGGVLLLLYWLGNTADDLASATPSPTATRQATPPPATTPPGGDQATPEPTPEASASPEPSFTPEPTPEPAGMQPGAVPSQSLESFVPARGRIFTISDGSGMRRTLTGSFFDSLTAEGDLDAAQNMTGQAHTYFRDDAGNIRYAQIDDEANGVIFLPAGCQVGSVWTSGSTGYEVVAVNFTATLGGAQVENCVVVKSGTTYRFYAPGVGLHTVRASLTEDTGATFAVIGQTSTDLVLEDMIAVG